MNVAEIRTFQSSFIPDILTEQFRLKVFEAYFEDGYYRIDQLTASVDTFVVYTQSYYENGDPGKWTKDHDTDLLDFEKDIKHHLSDLEVEVKDLLENYNMYYESFDCSIMLPDNKAKGIILHRNLPITQVW